MAAAEATLLKAALPVQKAPYTSAGRFWVVVLPSSSVT